MPNGPAFIILRDTALAAMRAVAPAIRKSSTLPILASVRITASEVGNRLEFCGTDLEMTIKAEAGGRVTTPGVVCVDAQRLNELIQIWPDEEAMEMSVTGPTSLRVTGPNIDFTLTTRDAGAFPLLPDPTDSQVTVSLRRGLFLELLESVIQSAAEDMTRPALVGINFTFTRNRVTLRATDAFRLTVTSADIVYYGDDASFTMPLLAAKAARVIFSAQANLEEDITLVLTKRRGDGLFTYPAFEIRDSAKVLICRTVDALYPDFTPIMIKRNPTLAIDPSAWSNAMAFAHLVARHNANQVTMTYHPKTDLADATLEISATSTEFGSVTRNIPVAPFNEGLETFSFCVAGHYVRQMLSVFHKKDEMVVFTWAGRANPLLFESSANLAYQHIIMPMVMPDPPATTRRRADAEARPDDDEDHGLGPDEPDDDGEESAESDDEPNTTPEPTPKAARAAAKKPAKRAAKSAK